MDKYWESQLKNYLTPEKALALPKMDDKAGWEKLFLRSRNAPRNRRKRLVRAIRQEGRDACSAGRHIDTNPYQCMDAYQWRRGWFERDEEMSSIRHALSGVEI